MMFSLLLTAALNPGLLGPTVLGLSTDDLSRFPKHWDCNKQIRRLEKHREYLDEIRPVTGWSNGWQAAVDQTEWNFKYWQLLYQAHNSAYRYPGLSISILIDLRDHIGSDRYLEGWHPGFIPEKSDPPVESHPFNP
jgi:hypothetical protein